MNALIHSRAAARRTASYDGGFYPLMPIVDADASKIDFVKEINRLIVLLREECDKVRRTFNGFDVTNAPRRGCSAVQSLEEIKRAQGKDIDLLASTDGFHLIMDEC